MNHNIQGQPSSQVWLPNMKVWARMPDRCAETALEVPVTRQPGDAGGEAASQKQQYGPVRHTAVDLAAETDSDVECLEPDNAGTDEESSLPTCPICLGEILGRWDKAVVISCMHVFCLACLSRWSALKRSCPLCKSRIQGYMYNIISETDYSEQMLPASPPRMKEPSPPMIARPNGARAIIDEPPAHHRPAQQGRAQGTAYRADRPLISSRPGERRALFRQSSNPQSNEWVYGTWPPRRPARQRQPASSSAQQRSEPRPYFYRVQAQAQSQAQAAARDRADVARSPQDAAEAWRRHIYVEGLYAQPMEGGPAVAVPPVMPEQRRQHRLEAWVDRELRALLQTDDVAIVRAYVMGLVRGIGFVGQQEGAEGSREQAAGSARTDATAALKPFLHEHAAHFWHELRCFAAVSVSMQTYDRLVTYSPRQSADAQGNQPNGTHASSSSECHLSSSRERSPNASRQQPGGSSSSREVTEQGRRHVHSRLAGEGAQSDSSIARQAESAQGRAQSEATTGTGQSYGRVGRASESRDPHRTSDRKRRRLFTGQPPAELSEEGRPCSGQRRSFERTREAVNGVRCCSSEQSQHPAGSTTAVRCSRGGSSGPSSGSIEEGQARHRDEGHSPSNRASTQGMQRDLIQGAVRTTKIESNAGANVSTSSGSNMLAELRTRALAAVRAHREHL